MWQEHSIKHMYQCSCLSPAFLQTNYAFCSTHGPVVYTGGLWQSGMADPSSHWGGSSRPLDWTVWADWWRAGAPVAWNNSASQRPGPAQPLPVPPTGPTPLSASSGHPHCRPWTRWAPVSRYYSVQVNSVYSVSHKLVFTLQAIEKRNSVSDNQIHIIIIIIIYVKCTTDHT